MHRRRNLQTAFGPIERHRNSSSLRKPAGEARYSAEPFINLSKSIVNLTLHERAPECENLQGEPMREIAIIITAMAAPSAMSRGDAHFVPLPTFAWPAAYVP